MQKFVAKLIDLPIVISYRNLSDEALMEKIATDDKYAFDTLYDRYVDQVWSFIFYRVNHHERAIELVQDVMLKIYKQASSFNLNSKFGPWLWTIVRHHLIDDYKSKDALGPSMLRQSPRDTNSQVEDLNILEEQLTYENEGEDPFVSLINKTGGELIQECFKNLPPNQREILSLKILTDLSLEDIAKQCDKKVGAVKSIIFRARESLMMCLEKKGIL